MKKKKRGKKNTGHDMTRWSFDKYVLILSIIVYPHH